MLKATRGKWEKPKSKQTGRDAPVIGRIAKFTGRSLLAGSEYSVRVGHLRSCLIDSSSLENEIDNFIKGLRG